MAIAKSGRYYYITYKLKLPNGEFKTRNIKNKEWKSKRYVQSIELEEIENDKAKVMGGFYNPNKCTFKELCENYLESIKLRFKKETVYNKSLLIKNYLENAIPSKQAFQKICAVNNFSRFLSLLQKYNYENSKTNNLYNRLISLLKDILNFAMLRDIISIEQYQKVLNLLSRVKEKKQIKDDVEFWTPEEFDTFIKTFDQQDEMWRPLFLTTYWCALRIGEVLALKWNDFDYNKHTISVNKTLDRQSEISTTKNISSNATVDLPNFLVEELKQFKYDLGASDNDYMFFKKHTSRTSIRRVFDEHTKIANIKHIKFHGLRHSMASRMINAGLNPLIVSKHLRHASTQQTLDTYSHLFPKITKGCIDNLV